MKAEGHLYANYMAGYVIWKGERMAKWVEASGQIGFTEKSREYQEAFRKFMGA